MATILITFSIDSETDKALNRWLQGIAKGQKSAEIRRVLNENLDRTVSLLDIYQAIEKLQRSGVTIEAPGNEEPQTIAPDILENLANLGQ